MADFSPAFAHLYPSLRMPTAGEIDNGFGCGPLDLDLFNGLWNALYQELGALITLTGGTPTNAKMQQLAEAMQSGGLNWAVATGSANAWTVTPALAVPAYAAGRVLWIKPPAVNTSTTVNANVSTLGNRRVKKADGIDPVPGDFGVRWYPFLDDGTNLCAVAFLPSDLAANKSPFNVTRILYNARVSLSGSGQVTYQTGTYTKKSATSQLVVEVSTNLFATGTAAGFGRVSGLPTNLDFTTRNADGSVSSPACTGSKIYAGLAAGVVNWTWSFGRGDALAWNSIINPRTTDTSYLPAETTSFIQFSELEP